MIQLPAVDAEARPRAGQPRASAHFSRAFWSSKRGACSPRLKVSDFLFSLVMSHRTLDGRACQPYTIPVDGTWMVHNGRQRSSTEAQAQ